MSRDALMIRSRRSWCSSSSLRKPSNIGTSGDADCSGLPSAIFGSSLLRLVLIDSFESEIRVVDSVQANKRSRLASVNADEDNELGRMCSASVLQAASRHLSPVKATHGLIQRISCLVYIACANLLFLSASLSLAVAGVPAIPYHP